MWRIRRCGGGQRRQPLHYRERQPPGADSTRGL